MNRVQNWSNPAVVVWFKHASTPQEAAQLARDGQEYLECYDTMHGAWDAIIDAERDSWLSVFEYRMSLGQIVEVDLTDELIQHDEDEAADLSHRRALPGWGARP